MHFVYLALIKQGMAITSMYLQSVICFTFQGFLFLHALCLNIFFSRQEANLGHVSLGDDQVAFCRSADVFVV